MGEGLRVEHVGSKAVTGGCLSATRKFASRPDPVTANSGGKTPAPSLPRAPACALRGGACARMRCSATLWRVRRGGPFERGSLLFEGSEGGWVLLATFPYPVSAAAAVGAAMRETISQGSASEPGVPA